MARASYWNHYNPVRIIAGAGAINHIGLCMEQFFPAPDPSETGKQKHTGTILLLTSKGFTRRGAVDRLCGIIVSARPWVHMEIHDSVQPNPDMRDMESLTHKYKGHTISGIIAMGGGSVLDTGKVLSVLLPHIVANSEYAGLEDILCQGKKPHFFKKIPLIAIPTTAGTGAEVTPFATIWDALRHKKYSLSDNLVFPCHALSDPELTLSLPEEETVNTGLDALSHALESLWNINRTPLSEALAWQALYLGVKALPAVLEQPESIDKRAQMTHAALLSGLAISQTKTALAHSISYPLTSRFNIPHGLACSFTLAEMIRLSVKEKVFPVHYSALLKELIFLLESLGLKNRIGKYASFKDILNENEAMHTPERADNCIIKPDLIRLLKQSLNI
nr:phosphonoacetaldehyde reductase [Desulfobotulus alkaliphilus]